MIKEVLVDKIEPNKYNPNVLKGEKYEALKQDMVNGDYDPIQVSPKDVFYGTREATEKFVIIDGEYRWRAAKDVDLKSILADVRPIAIFEAKPITFKRNRVRGHLDPFKEAALFNEEVEGGLTEEEVADRYGVSRSYVAGRRMLLKSSSKVKGLYYEPENTLKKDARPKIRSSIEQHAKQWDLDKTEEEIKQETEEQLEEIVPHGTLTAGHLKAIAGLPQQYQDDIAESIVHSDLTVRDAEEKAKQAKEKIEKQERFQKALKKARQKTCPSCGAEADGFSWNEHRFRCFSCYETWDPMVTKKELKERAKQREKATKTLKSKEMKEKLKNPGYVRRLETVGELDAKIRPWILGKVKQLEEIEYIKIVGFKGDQAIEIEYPRSFQNSLSFNTGPKEKEGDEWWRRWERKFCFSIQHKDYKTLEEKSKLDIHANQPSPERRAEIHHFLDNVVNTEQDPFLPEEHKKEILKEYGEVVD